jgi:rod shape-determining protein MreC
MPLGTLDRNPPPMFRQGPSAFSKLVFFSALAVFLMAADTRFQIAVPIRFAIGTVLEPVERVLRTPVEMVTGGSAYLRGLHDALAAEDAARKRLADQAERAARGDQLAAENARLRALLQLRPAIQVKSITAEVLYQAADVYSRKVMLDRGSTDGVVLGAPVINDFGVLGQVTRVYPFHSELTLLTDKDASIPVLDLRTQQRYAAYGTSLGGGLTLRFVADDADVKPGDLLVTSGVDGVYPPGIPVAKVTAVDRKGESGFARIDLATTAQPDSVRYALVLQPIGLQMSRPAAEAAAQAARTAPSARPGKSASGAKATRGASSATGKPAPASPAGGKGR